MIFKNKYKSNTSGISNIYYASTKKAWVFEKSINKVKHRKRFYGKKNNKDLLKQAIQYKQEYETYDLVKKL